jgi:dihydrofolate synthase/folylpolyglutamate synthase
MSDHHTYQAILDEMFGLQRFGIKLGLETIGNILDNLGRPQDNFDALHIAGTNGKGSIAATLTAVLAAAGYTTGLYTSPHLVRFNERIRINGQPVTDEQVVEAYRAVRAAHRGDRQPTFFEFTTAMAMHEFDRRRVDWAVIETGMGGRLDATNMIVPYLSIITNISIEHKEYLGGTIAAIAAEKAGIIKPGVPVVTGVRQPSAVAVVEGVAAKQGAALYRIGHDFKTRRNKDGSFNYYGIDHTWRHLTPPLLGDHQVENTALVLASCEALCRNGVELDIDVIINGFENTRWPGRLEIVSQSPLVILDGAHNLKAARCLADFMTARFSGRDITLVAGILDDKPYAQMLAALLPVCSRAVITRPRIGRALPPEALSREARKHLDDVRVVDTVATAVREVIGKAQDDEVICIAGSLYVVGEAKETLEKYPHLIRP